MAKIGKKLKKSSKPEIVPKSDHMLKNSSLKSKNRLMKKNQNKSMSCKATANNFKKRW